MNISPHILWTLLRKPVWLESMFKSPAHWDRDITSQSATNNLLTRRDDAAHLYESPFYFEWWYFDISLPDGAALVFIFHLTDLIRPAAKTGSLNVSFFRPGRPGWTQFTPYPRHEITASATECDVQMGKNRCWVDPEGVYHILIDEPEVKAAVTFAPLVSGWRPGDGTIKFGDPQRFFSWVVPQPRAKVTGYVQLQDSRWEIEGVGYHDHNWGTVSLIETLNAWSWGRIYMDDYTLIYADMLLSPRYSPSRSMPFLLADKKQPLVSSFLHENAALDSHHDFLFAPDKVQQPKGWNLSWHQANGGFDLTLRTKHVLEQADLIRDHHPLVRKIIGSLLAHPYYVRCVTDVEGEITFQGKTVWIPKGKAICEQIVLRTPANSVKTTSQQSVDDN